MGNELDAGPGEGVLQSGKKRLEDRCFLTGKRGRCGERRDVQIGDSHRPVVGDAGGAIQRQIENLIERCCAAEICSIGKAIFGDGGQLCGLGILGASSGTGAAAHAVNRTAVLRRLDAPPADIRCGAIRADRLGGGFVANRAESRLVLGSPDRRFLRCRNGRTLERDRVVFDV